MNASPRIRLLTREDLPFADSIRAIAGWNQTMADWKRFVAVEPEGCFVAEWNGVPAGTATTTVYGPGLAWIGMVLVHPDQRRRGIGRALLERCIEHLRKCGVRCIKLDATPAGKMVYDGLGFKDEWTLTRWEHAAADWPKVETMSNIRTCRDVDIIESLDAAAFGVSRKKVLKPLMSQSRCALVCESDGTSTGYGLLRDGSSALYLGPVVATSADAGVRLVKTLLEHAADRKIYWDIPDQNVASAELARELGFTAQRTLTRMYLGENSMPGHLRQQFAIAAPEVG